MDANFFLIGRKKSGINLAQKCRNLLFKKLKQMDFHGQMLLRFYKLITPQSLPYIPVAIRKDILRTNNHHTIQKCIELH